MVRKEKNNALQWAEWGFDYLKYDWRPCDPYNAELMRKELVETDRDFGFCVSVRAWPEYHTYWKKYCNSYRCNTDSIGNWDNLIEESGRMIHVFKKKLAGGDFAIAAFNLGDKAENVKVYLDEVCSVRDAWARKDLPDAETLSLSMQPHTVRVFRLSSQR